MLYICLKKISGYQAKGTMKRKRSFCRGSRNRPGQSKSTPPGSSHLLESTSRTQERKAEVDIDPNTRYRPQSGSPCLHFLPRLRQMQSTSTSDIDIDFWHRPHLESTWIHRLRCEFLSTLVLLFNTVRTLYILSMGWGKDMSYGFNLVSSSHCIHV